MLDIFQNADTNSHLPSISEKEISDEEVLYELAKLKKKLSSQMVVLGHHYQNDDVIGLADITGDSLALAKRAAQLDVPYIVFCGVHFMAETADMLTKEHQKVILPDLNAGCSMADMATSFQINKSWDYLTSCTDEKIVPITYVNCSAELKSFVGKNSGAICTSSNAKKIIQWALDSGEKLLFFPDQHLGRNTCFELGISLDEMVVYNPNHLNGGLTPAQIKKAKVILWYGYCSVHQGFTAEQVNYVKNNEPDRCVIVHPECSFDVVQAADKNGSTAQIIEEIKNSRPGSKFAVGTEVNLVSRLNKTFSDKDVISLSPYQCLCTTMYRIRPRWLLETFRSIDKGAPINVIKVDDEITKNSLVALDKMLSIC